MTPPANGITPEVIRDLMPPYHLSTDLLEDTIATLRPPPPNACAAWKQARLARVIEEISALMPANAAQARSAADIVVAREMAKTLAVQGQDPALTGPQRCRMFRVSGELERTAEGLRRGLERTQQKPAPFFGTVLADEVDVVALAAGWGTGAAESAADCPAAAEAGSSQRELLDAAPCPEPESAARPDPAGAGGKVDAVSQAMRAGGVEPESPGDQPDAGAPVAGADGARAMTPMPPASEGTATVGTATVGPARRGGSTEAAGCVETDARSTAEGVVTRLDQGPGWTLEVVRPRTAGGTGAAAGVGTLPGSRG